MNQPHVCGKRDDRARDDQSNDSHAPRETAQGRKLRNSPNPAAAKARSTPPASICAPELMSFDCGSGSLRVSADESDQLIAAMISATAPALSIGAPPRLNEWLVSTATPPIPVKSAIARRSVSFCVRRKMISDSAMNTG